MPTWRVPIEITSPYVPDGASNVFHIRGDSATEFQLMVDALNNFYEDASSLFAAETSIDLGAGVDIATNEPAPEPASPWRVVTQPAGIGSAPPHLALCVSWRTTQRTRRGTGRTFMGPLQSAALASDGTVNDSVVATLQTAANTLVATSTALNNGAIAIYGYENAVPAGGARLPTDPRVARDITGANVRDVFAVLRSRRD